jgi:hypothetical protein
MHRTLICLPVLTMLAACSAPPASDQPATEPAKTEIVASGPTTPSPASPATEQPAQRPRYAAPCPGYSDDIRRPLGSNCLGILPTACGADRVADIIGARDTPALRARVSALLGNGNQRWIAPGEPVTEDLRPDRLNVELDAQGRVAVVDCY